MAETKPLALPVTVNYFWWIWELSPFSHFSLLFLTTCNPCSQNLNKNIVMHTDIDGNPMLRPRILVQNDRKTYISRNGYGYVLLNYAHCYFAFSAFTLFLIHYFDKLTYYNWVFVFVVKWRYSYTVLSHTSLFVGYSLILFTVGVLVLCRIAFIKFVSFISKAVQCKHPFKTKTYHYNVYIYIRYAQKQTAQVKDVGVSIYMSYIREAFSRVHTFANDS